jgi:AbiEi antitoxin C-terminal domain/Protein of unknown function (DUF559)
VLACGPGAALSHRTAADLWGLRQTAAAQIDVTVPTRAGRKPRSRIRVHRAQLASAEVTMVDGIPVTTVPRTLIDLAEPVPERSVQRALDEAELLRVFDRHAIEAAIERNRGRPGAATVRRLLTTHAAGSTRTASDLEECFLSLCRAAGRPQPEVNARLKGFELDFLCGAGLVAETGGYPAHGARRAFESDRRRDVELRAAGYIVVRFTDRQLVEGGDWVVERLRSFLGASSSDSR